MYRIQFDNYKRTSFCSTFVLIRVFVALASSYQFFFDFLVSLVSLIVSLTVFVTYSSYSIQSAEDCKSRFSLTAKNMFWLNLTTFFHLYFFVQQKKAQKSIFLRVIITFVYLITEQYPITRTQTYPLKLLSFSNVF